MKLSIVDTSPISAGSTAVEAFRTTRELAEFADEAAPVDRLTSYRLIAEVFELRSKARR